MSAILTHLRELRPVRRLRWPEDCRRRAIIDVERMTRGGAVEYNFGRRRQSDDVPASSRQPRKEQLLMFAEYVQAAMNHAVYEQFEDGSYFGSIPGFRGVLANEATLEETQRELQSVLEDWLQIGIAEQEELPEVDGLRLTSPKANA